MERKSRKLTAAQRGKTIIPITETPVSSVAHTRGSGRNRSVASGMDSTGTAGSAPLRSSRRKRTIGDAEAVPETSPHLPLPPSMEDEEFLVLSQKVSRSVVTVASIMSMGGADYTFYSTGFILINEGNYSLIFTCKPPESNEQTEVEKYFIYPEGANANQRTEAYELIADDKFSVLITHTVRESAPVIFSDSPLGSELIFTIGVMAGTKLNANGPIIHELVGAHGTYRGKVLVPSYRSLDLKFQRLTEAEQFFEVTCPVHDEIITLDNVDNDNSARKADSILSAPVFRFDGKVGGLIYKHGNWGDVKCGLLAKGIISRIQKMCMEKNWEEELKKSANEYWAEHIINHP
ncbi:unnamed protein product [Urochloa humidicola]